MAFMFTLLLSIAAMTAGLTGYTIFGPLALQHQRDRGRSVVADSSFSWRFLIWLWRGHYHQLGDPHLDALATPARILSWCALLGGLGAAFSYILKG